MRCVILVPGFGCSVLTDGSRDSRHNSWMDVSTLIKPRKWLVKNTVSYCDGRFISRSRVGVMDLGGESGVRDLVPSLDWTGVDFGQRYFGKLIDEIKEDRPAAKLVGLPYDFRTITDPLTLKMFTADVVGSIERSGRKAVIVAHSMGAVVIRYVLSTLGEAWVGRNVECVIEICPAHGGTVYSLEAMIRGSFYIPVISEELRAMLSRASRHNSGLLLTLPNTMAFDKRDPVWVTEEGRRIYAERWPWDDVADAWKRCSLPLLRNVTCLPPSVSHYVIYGTGNPTAVSMNEMDGTDATEDGDGIIHVASATCGSCGHTKHVELGGCSHRMALYHDKTIALVKQFL